uniref:Ig-like domain-containing protein n=1 Tax=Sparus aurata TaxID=8175 RepID=A0A671WUN8_SPAAU
CHLWSQSSLVIFTSRLTLTCSSDANPAVKYTWYKKNGDPDLQPLSKEPQLVFSSIQSSDSGEYYCTAENELGRRTSEYISVNVTCEELFQTSNCTSLTWTIVEGSSVTLTCSSDANPAAKYTWYKENQMLSQGPDGIYHISSISSEDGGNYYCKSENLHGEINSSFLFIDCEYKTFKNVHHSLFLARQIYLRSDANPAANYTWYKEKQKLIQGPEGVYHFSSISSEDRGNYYCKSENQYGEINSSSLFIDVQYVPKLPSVSVSPSAEIVEGSSVTLTCSSDANPAANYTWYKENEDSPKASGQIFTITDFRAEHSGNYSCKAQNSRGRQNSTLQLLVVAGELLIPQHDPFLFSLVNPLRKPTPLSHVQLFLSNLQSRLDPIILVTSSVCSLSLFSSHTYTTHSFVFLYIEVFTGRPAQSWVCFYT